jgi:uncharacterized iron-regulated membrane protein
MAIAALLMPLFFITGLWMWIERRAAARRRALRAEGNDVVAGSAVGRRIARAT